MRKWLGAGTLGLLVASVALADGLTVYGQDWAFVVTEPSGWHGDTEASERYHVNIVFFPEEPQSSRTDLTIRIRVNHKTDENIAADLKVDMDEYRTKYPKVQFSDLALEHPKYPLVAKLFFVPGKFFEYVAYANPGKEYPYVLSVAMSKAKEAATPEEMRAYQKILGSILFIHKAP